MATHSSVLAWRIPGTGEPGGLPSLGSHRVGHNWSDLAAAARCIKVGLLCHLFIATSQTCSLKVRGQGRCVAGGWGSCVLFCKLFFLSICHLVLKWCVHCPHWPPGGQGPCILGLPWGVLGWPKTLFGLLRRWCGKTQMNFSANPIYWGGGLVSLSCPVFLQPHRLTVAGQVSSVDGMFKARILEWVAISSSRGFPQPQGSYLHLLNGHVDTLPTKPPNILEAQYIAVRMKF